MRSKVSSATWSNVITRKTSSSTYENPKSGSYIASRVDRSDIAQSTFDPTGWREPLPYQASGMSQVLWTGYGWWENTRYFDRSEFSGSGLQYGYDSYMNPPPLDHVDHIFPTWLEQRTINRALGDIKDGVVNYAVMLAESRKAADLVASTAKTIAYALKDVKRGRLKRAARRFGLSKRGFRDTFRLKKGSRGYDKEMSKRWLELQYGWMPLISDIYGVIEDAEKGFLREPRISVTKESRSSKTSYQYLDRGQNITFRGSAKTDTEFVCRVRLDYVLDISVLQTLAQKGVTNPASVLWEITPWSFVIDWFVPIGEYLSTLDNALGLTFKAGTITTLRRDTTTSELELHSYSSSYVCGGSCTGTLSDFQMYRNVLTTEPSGGLYFKSPFSASHALSALALLRSVIK